MNVVDRVLSKNRIRFDASRRRVKRFLNYKFGLSRNKPWPDRYTVIRLIKKKNWHLTLSTKIHYHYQIFG